ncbi:hypothetical protein ACPOL_3432 [Acidisarcina polymorpha]|uniref:Uncharacterized protein n=2 Tax=Acidisarcina polymorpha TaxID=2211140 RepID=A0A2Z5G102_9BACT|nr:hypothetical protein ACPOL_3432 [Acidisarcina polymorpha]
MGSRQFNPAIFGPGATVGNENSRRLYPGLGAVELAQSYEYSIYHALQANLPGWTTVANCGRLAFKKRDPFAKQIIKEADARSIHYRSETLSY